MEFKKLAYWSFIAFLLVVVFLMIDFMKSESRMCVANPYIYGASKMGNVDCSCVQYNSKVCPAQFHFNDTSFDAPPTRCSNGNGGVETQFSNINFSNLLITKE